MIVGSAHGSLIFIALWVRSPFLRTESVFLIIFSSISIVNNNDSEYNVYICSRYQTN